MWLINRTSAPATQAASQANGRLSRRHPRAGLMLRTEESGFRQVERLTNVLMRLNDRRRVTDAEA